MRPGRLDLRPERPDFRPEGSDNGGGRTNELTNERTKVPLCSTGLRPLRGRCPKTLKSHHFKNVTDRRTDRPTDRRTDGRTKPLRVACPQQKVFFSVSFPADPSRLSLAVVRCVKRLRLPAIPSRASRLPPLFCTFIRRRRKLWRLSPIPTMESAFCLRNSQ